MYGKKGHSSSGKVAGNYGEKTSPLKTKSTQETSLEVQESGKVVKDGKPTQYSLSYKGKSGPTASDDLRIATDFSDTTSDDNYSPEQEGPFEDQSKSRSDDMSPKANSDGEAGPKRKENQQKKVDKYAYKKKSSPQGYKKDVIPRNMDSLEEDESDEDLLGESEEASAGGRTKLPADREEGSNPAESVQGASKGYTPLSIKPGANDKETPAKPPSKKSTYPGKKTKSSDGAPEDTSNAAIGAEGDINQPSDVDQSPSKAQEKATSTGSSSGKEDTGNPKEKSAKKKQAVKKPIVPSDKGPTDRKRSGSNDQTTEIEKEDEAFNEVGSMGRDSYGKGAAESLEEDESDDDLVEEIPTGASPVPASTKGGPEEETDHKKSGSNDYTTKIEKEDEAFNEVGSMGRDSYEKGAAESLEEDESDDDLVEEIPTGASPVPASTKGGPEEKLPNYGNPSGKGPASGEKKSPDDALEKQTPGTKSPNPTDNSGEKFPVYGKPSMKGSKNESLEGSPQGVPSYGNPSGISPSAGEKKNPDDALEKQTPGTKSPNPTDNSGEKFPVYGKPSMKGSKDESLEGSPQGVPSYGNPSGISPSAGEKKSPDDALEKQTPGTKSPNPTDNSEEKADLESESQEYDYEPCNEGEEDCECMDPDGGEYEACEQGEEDCECEPETEECKEGEEGCECQDEELEYEKCEEGEEDCECYDEDVAPPAYKPKSSSPNAQNSAAEIIQLLNKERTNRHKPEIPTSPELNELAEQHASNYASAKQPSSSPSDWHGENKCNGATEECMESKLRSFGKYPGKGYEIAYKSTSSDPSAIVKGIMKNREYKREILSRKKWKSKPWSHIGAANKGEYTWIWFGVQDSKATPHVSGKTNNSSD
ncbi:hypothetical protein DSO57_1022331 [Entomophthora muscae]|uniref:Uncharacterized protein n=1 Tax=Entomophthora muscae TaxID=34485 RepID=A0ACC2T3H6_9FUNG|nr:hypothetical protein DSO57_1022331 [Entomophthora muscae]